MDGKPNEISTRRVCDNSRWNPAAERAVSTKEETKALNAYLDTLQAKAYEAKRRLIEAGRPITAAAIKEGMMGKRQPCKMRLQVFEAYTNHIKRLIGIDYSGATWIKYDRTRRVVQHYIQWKYSVPDVTLQRLDMEFVNDLELWLKTERRCGQNTTVKYISILKMIVLFCVDNNWLEKDPFACFKMKKAEVVPVFLSKEELALLVNKKITIERLRQVRDVFVFCCYTGLAYADIKKINTAEVAIGVDGDPWIFTRRLKTHTPARIPVLPAAQKILAAYEEHPPCVHSNRLLSVLSNQKCNSYLKELADICGLAKTLTTHTAQHTFATTVTLSNGLPMESVAKILGHKKLQTTQHYARVLDNKISDDIQALKQKLMVIHPDASC